MLYLVVRSSKPVRKFVKYGMNENYWKDIVKTIDALSSTTQCCKSQLLSLKRNCLR